MTSENISQIFQKRQPKNQEKTVKIQFWLKNTLNPVLKTGMRQCSEISQKPFKVNVKSRPSNWHINKNLIK